MRKTGLVFLGLLAAGAWLAPMQGQAIMATGGNQQAAQTETTTSYLSGYFIAWQGGTLVTTVGKFPINTGVDLLDRAHTAGRTYTKDDKQGTTRPHVQLEFHNGQLRKVIIY